MAENNVTNLKSFSDHPDVLRLIKALREIRRANAGIDACNTILNQHSINSECSTDHLGVHIQLTPDDAGCLGYAIETCARHINLLFENLPILGDVMWDEEYLPAARRMAELRRDMLGRKISEAEFEREALK